MKTTTKLKQQISLEQQKVADKLQELKQQNQNDQEALNQLKRNYAAAVTTGDNASIDSIHEQIRSISQQMQQRGDVIEGLSLTGSPTIQKLVVDAIREWIQHLAETKEQAGHLHEELLPLHRQLVSGLGQLNKLWQEEGRLASFINDFSQMLSKESFRELGLSPNAEIDRQTINKHMHQLVIERHSVFRR